MRAVRAGVGWWVVVGACGRPAAPRPEVRAATVLPPTATVVAPVTAPVPTGPRIVEQGVLQGEHREQDGFGSAVAVSGDTVVVAAPTEGAWGRGKLPGGAVYVFTRANGHWTQQARIEPRSAHAEFGRSVAVEGDTLVVGAYAADEGIRAPRGAVYVFTREGSAWTERVRLRASGGRAWSAFGDSVALSGGTIAVGAPGFGSSEVGEAHARVAGAVYVFEREGAWWMQRARLVSAHGNGNDTFGRAVALDENTLAVGEPGDHAHDYDGHDRDARLSWNVESGSVSVYSRTGRRWVRQAQLDVREGENLMWGTFDAFGTSIALDGNLLVAGGPELDHGWGTAGVFERIDGRWARTFVVQVHEHSRGSVGAGVGVGDGLIAIENCGGCLLGAQDGPPGHYSAGSVTLYEARQGQRHPVESPAVRDLRHSDRLGGAMAFDGATLVVGSPLDDCYDNETFSLEEGRPCLASGGVARVFTVAR